MDRPSNREELRNFMARVVVTENPGPFAYEVTDDLLAAFDAAGLAILPKEPTPAMRDAGGDAINVGPTSAGHCIKAALAASPFKEAGG
jgi:hypothetical protein